MDYKIGIYFLLCHMYVCYTLANSMIMVPKITTFLKGYDRNILKCSHNSTSPLLGVHWTYSYSLTSERTIVFTISATGEEKAFGHLAGRASVYQSASLLIKDVNFTTDEGIYECGMTFVGEQLIAKKTFVRVYDLPMNGTRKGPVLGGNCDNLPATGFRINFQCSINAPGLQMIYDWTIDNIPQPGRFAKTIEVLKFGDEAVKMSSLHVQCTGKLKEHQEIVFYSPSWDCKIGAESTRANGEPMLGWHVGLGVGLGVLIIFIVALALFLYKRRSMRSLETKKKKVPTATLR